MKRSRFVASAAGAAVLTAVPAIAFASADMTLRTPTGTLAGTLELPATANGTPPVVLLIAGSGPTDRDGNSPLLPGKNDALKLLALGLAQRGVASLRYDKRTTGASVKAPAESDLRFDTYVDDAVAWLRELRSHKRFSRVAIAGHSEGSLTGMIAAQREPVDGFASLEGAGHAAPLVLRDQLVNAPASIRDAGDAIIAQLAAGNTVADVPANLQMLFRASVQPYLISWFRYDPQHELAALKMPVTIVQGTADVQTAPSEGAALHAAAPAARYVIVEGMNHMLKHAPDVSSSAALLAGYTDPSLPVVPAVIDAVAALAAP